MIEIVPAGNSFSFRVDNVQFHLVMELVKELTGVSYVKYRKPRWMLKPERTEVTEYYYHYDPTKQEFTIPIGWLDEFLILLDGKEIQYRIVDNHLTEYSTYNRDSFSLPSDLFSDKYKFQGDAILECFHKRRGIIQHPTGSGKTITIMKLVADLGLPTLVIVPNLTLLEQTYHKFKHYFPENSVGYLGDSIFDFSKYNIATVQTLWYWLKQSKDDTQKNAMFSSLIEQLKNDTKVLILDEAHHASISNKRYIKGMAANSWFWVAYAIKAPFRFGFTATPGEGYQFKMLKGVVGNVIHKLEISDLVDQGVLVGAKILMYEVPVTNSSYDWSTAFENLITSEDRNKKIAELANQFQVAGKKVLIITNRIEKQSLLLKELISHSDFLSGQSSAKERTDVISKTAGNNKVLIGTIFGEGTDIPCIDVVILASGGKSSKSVLQRLGRGLRTFEGKSEVLIVDFLDKDKSLLEKHSWSRYNIYKQEKAFRLEIIHD